MKRNEHHRKIIERQVKEYLAKGGTIKQCTALDNKGWNFDPHRPAIIMRNELKAATWERQLQREQTRMA